MTFKTDNGGLALKLEAKVTSSSTASTWNTKLSQIHRVTGDIFICTYSLPDLDYCRLIFDKRTIGVTLLMNSKFIDKAEQLKRLYPDLKILLAPNTHAKIVLVEPDTIWLSSANFGKSNWFETSVGLRSKKAHDYYKNNIQCFLAKNDILEL